MFLFFVFQGLEATFYGYTLVMMVLMFKYSMFFWNNYHTRVIIFLHNKILLNVVRLNMIVGKISKNEFQIAENVFVFGDKYSNLL